jgi:hypothetical protein
MMPRVEPDRVRELAAELGLPWGRMITESKSWYGRAHPEHLAVFNATVADEAGTDLWWGDLDLTLDEPKLAALDAANAVARFTPDGEVLGPGPSDGTLDRDEEGRLRRRRATESGPEAPG